MAENYPSISNLCALVHARTRSYTDRIAYEMHLGHCTISCSKHHP